MRPCAVALALVLTGAPVAAQLPRSTQRVVMVSEFSRLRVTGPYTVEVVSGPSPSARIEGSGAALDRITIRQSGDLLTIVPNTMSWAEAGVADDSDLVVRLVVPHLTLASLTGAGRLHVDRLSGLKVFLYLAGPGTLTVDQLNADALEVVGQGPGDIRLAGKALTARLALRGSASLTAPDLVVDDLVLSSAGPGRTQLSATRAASVVASGPTSVIVTGNAACTVNRSGAAQVQCGVPPSGVIPR